MRIVLHFPTPAPKCQRGFQKSWYGRVAKTVILECLLESKTHCIEGDLCLRKQASDWAVIPRFVLGVGSIYATWELL